MNTTNTLTYNQAAEMIYSKEFTNSLIKYLYVTKNKLFKTISRKYKDDVMRHEDVTEFIIDKLVSILQDKPQLLAVEVWNDSTDLYKAERCYFFKIYLNFCIDRFDKYCTIQKHEIQLTDSQEQTMRAKKADIDTKEVEAKLVNKIAFRKAWINYTDTLNSVEKIIAMYLLDGCLTMKELEALTGLKKSAIYLKIPAIQLEINKLAGLLD